MLTEFWLYISWTDNDMIIPIYAETKAKAVDEFAARMWLGMYPMLGGEDPSIDKVVKREDLTTYIITYSSDGGEREVPIIAETEEEAKETFNKNIATNLYGENNVKLVKVVH